MDRERSLLALGTVNQGLDQALFTLGDFFMVENVIIGVFFVLIEMA